MWVVVWEALLEERPLHQPVENLLEIKQNLHFSKNETTHKLHLAGVCAHIPAGTAAKVLFMSKEEDRECEAWGRGGGGGGATTLSPSGDAPD